MKLMNFWESGNLRLGVKKEEGILDVAAALNALPQRAAGAVPATLREVLDGGEAALDSLRKFADSLPYHDEGAKAFYRDETLLEFAPCTADPGKIICIGLNYRRHAEETGMPLPEYPILFSKFSNSLSGHGMEVPLPYSTQKVDYEAELGIMIGRTAKNVSEEEALDAVFGYFAANDLSARDLQTRTSQWLAGKSCDRFAPVGPYVVTEDEVGDPGLLRISCSVNGEVRQDSNTSDMIFDCRQIISYISSCMTLSPGDIILTGTPEGVMMGYPPEKQVYLQPGDEVTVEIEKLGRLTNRMVAEKA
ncbi:fumarylacetoacetate hydrolase family protein [Paenibacillus riograndensis]|uniref:5-carboxymethyl-2-hydroxymuconate delta-isomerase n=2 Tax=Paenibacillus riograndensis TaxID=483937 RepID=A0A0E4CXV8_9BACL|nr:fumarylacetoacetate hydrolase family protein [Paenibacillus riograndensis]CQR56764.1 5-carboxymethyl-2-hydroxymuconate delta-isomerase [Paenibacillus riograndensis SBR5]